MSYDDHLTDSEKEMWSSFYMFVDVAVMVAEEEEEESKFHKTDSVDESHKRIFYLFPRKTRSSLMKRRYTQQNPNDASTSSSPRLDLNNIPTDSETENAQNSSSESEAVVFDEEQRAKKGKSKIVFEEDYEYESKKRFFEKKYVSRRYLQQNCVINLNGASTSSSSSLVPFNYNTAEYEKTETNPNYQTSPSSCLTENTSRKRCAVKQRKSKVGFKKAKIASFPREVRETPEWVYQVIRDMNGDAEEEPRLFFERSLSASDVNLGQSRLLIPFNQLIRNDFLTTAESLAMENEEEDEDNIGVGTILVNQRSEKWGLRFKIWPMKKDSGKGTLNYALNWGWNDVVKGNNLKEDGKISLWTFRCRGVLCFALEIA